jgi:hypothetical protein
MLVALLLGMLLAVGMLLAGWLNETITESRVCRYDQEAVFFESGVRGQVQQELQHKLLADLEPVYRAQVALRRAHALTTRVPPSLTLSA